MALALALALARPTLRALRVSGWRWPNYRGRELPAPLGVLVVIAALFALVLLAPVERLARVTILDPRVGLVALYVLGVALLGLIDDLLGSPVSARPAPTGGGGSPPPATGASALTGSSVVAGVSAPTGVSVLTGAPALTGVSAPRGWRGHGAAVLRGELSTGAVKALGALGLALLTTSYLPLTTGRWLLAAAVLTLATNALNLLDVRPGRAVKAWAALGLGLTVGTGDVGVLWTLGLFVGPALVAGWLDLRERAMLGDTGASLLGGLAGLWIVLSLGVVGQLVALGLLVAMTVYGELRSISALIARVPLLRKLDSWGRPSSSLSGPG